MGLVRADWHLPEVEMDASDPFDKHSEIATDESPQVAAEARRPGDEVYTHLSDLVLEEACLDARGVTCPLKDRDWCHPTCSSCPERGDVARAELCRVGLAQEAALAVHRERQ